MSRDDRHLFISNCCIHMANRESCRTSVGWVDYMVAADTVDGAGCACVVGRNHGGDSSCKALYKWRVEQA